MRRIAILSVVLVCAILIAVPVGTGDLEAPSAIPQNSTAIIPRFELSYHRGQLRVHGHTLSARHERRLMDAASHLSGDHETTFEPLGVAPDYWPLSTVRLVQAISTTRSSTAVLTNSRLTIRGLVAESWPQQMDSLREALPESIQLSVDVTAADATLNIESLCSRVAKAFKAGPVNFEESGTRFRSSAYPVLDRVVALADSCRGPKIAITGHSDSSGNEASNQQLSLARATAVANYIARRGIAKDRLVISGAGSSIPVADNGTRYGRGVNRRIDIELRP